MVIRGPGQILDGPGYGLELILEYVLLVHRVPDPHLPCTNGFSSSISNLVKIRISVEDPDFNRVSGIQIGISGPDQGRPKFPQKRKK